MLLTCAQSCLSRLVYDKVIFARLQIACRCNFVEYHSACWWRGVISWVIRVFGIVRLIGVVGLIGVVRIVWLSILSRNNIVGIIKCRVGLGSPYVLFQSRIVHIWVSVQLQLIYGVVSVHLFFAHGVFVGPTNKHVQSPFG